MQPKTISEIFEERKLSESPPSWLQEMREYYLKTGKVRAEDLYRLLGDPLRCVQSGPRPSLSSFLGK